MVLLAVGEWARYGRQVITYSADADPRTEQLGVKEREAPQRIHDYWASVGHPERSGLDDVPWSAAFISWDIESAGVPRDLFCPSQTHTIYVERLVERAAELGEILLSGLRAIDSPVVREIRGLGLFSGIEIDPAWASAREVAMRLLARGILTRDTHHTVVRVAPPLVISRTQLEWALKNIRSVLAEIERGLKRAA